MLDQHSDVMLHYQKSLEKRVLSLEKRISRLKRTISIMATGLFLVSAVAVLEFFFIH